MSASLRGWNMLERRGMASDAGAVFDGFMAKDCWLDRVRMGRLAAILKVGMEKCCKKNRG